MGAGASKGNSGGRAGVSSNAKINEEFDGICLAVFRKADVDGNGTLDRKEFAAVLRSKTLNLNLSNEEMDDLQRMTADTNGRVSYENFVPLLRRLLPRVYQKKATDWNDWCRVSLQ